MDLGSTDTWRWLWLGTAVVFTLGEIAIAGSFFLAPFAIAAGLAAAVAFLGGSVLASWIGFVVAAIAASAVLRPLARRLAASSPPSTVGGDRWVGRVGVVIGDIPAGHAETGLVRLEREEWRAQSDAGQPIASGVPVLITRVDGTRLVVREQPLSS